jgi:hypothetical protein
MPARGIQVARDRRGDRDPHALPCLAAALPQHADFRAADEASLGTAREVMRKALAWRSIADEGRLQQQLTQAQAADASDKAKSNRDAAHKASSWPYRGAD